MLTSRAFYRVKESAWRVCVAIHPVLQSGALNPVLSRLSGESAQVLAALQTGQTVDAFVLARLETGEVRLGLLGILLDVMPPEPLAVGDAVALTVIAKEGELAVSLARLPRGRMISTDGADPPAAPPATQPLASVLAPGKNPAVALSSQAAPLLAPRGMPASVIAPSSAAISAGTANAVTVAVPGEPARAPVVEPRRDVAISPLAQAALSQMVPRAATNQNGRAPLLANAIAVLSGVASERLPESVRRTLSALVATGIDARALDAPALRQAILRSGTFQEAALLRLADAALADLPEPATVAEAAHLRGDAKTVMLSLRGALRAMLGERQAAMGGAEPSPAPPPLPRLGAAPPGQPAATASVSSDTTPFEAARSLLSGTEGALDRLRLLQAASLPDTARGSEAAGRGDRLVEIALALPHGQVPVVSLAIGRDGRGGAAPREETPTWRMRLSLDLEPVGAMHAHVSLRGETAGITVWAEKPETAELLRSSLYDLREALIGAELGIETLEVRLGAPPQAPSARAGSFVDRRT
jgi:hypothetical protein